jgi:HD-GYP domain-containing protein (c-di-GMP phosphodiesterase class II)
MIGLQIFRDNRKELHKVGMGSLLLDVGMTEIDKKLWTDTTRLDTLQILEIQSHVKISHEILLKHDLDPDILEMVLYHHERLDGSGYPFGLSGNEIGLYVRIASVSDVYNALTSERSYRKPYSHINALRIMAGNHQKFDKEVFDCLMRIVLPNKDLVEKIKDKIGRSQ